MSEPVTSRVRGNDWSLLGAPEPEAYTPRHRVSVVIPAYRARDTLPYTLAALRAQTYPSHLLEVVVVDDDDGPPLELPELRPDNVRVVKAPGSWGRAHACRTGAELTEGEVIHWLDADMLPSHDHVALHMRWHHVTDHAVVLGHKLFVDPAGLPLVGEVHEAVLEDRLPQLFAGGWIEEHEWVEKIWQRTDDLRAAGFRAFHVHVGATASVSRELYEGAGGMDASLKLGEDIELGYRLAMKGAVFVGERRATSWHLGRSQLMTHEQQVQRYNAPFVAQRVPDFRKFRQERGRSYRVPYIEVVVETAGSSYEQLKFTLDGALRAQPADLRCLLVGPWSDLGEDRRRPLEDPCLDLRLLREEYEADPRVVLVEEAPGPSAFPAQFRLHLPGGWRPGPTSLARLAKDMQRRSHGLRSVLMPDGQVARIERTAAVERALRLRRAGEDLDDVLDAVAGTWWSEGLEEGFESPTTAPPPVPRRRRPTTEEGVTAPAERPAARARGVRTSLRRVLRRSRP